MDTSSGRKLEGWEAIGGYLGITGKTARKRRRIGLPVHQLPGDKSPVWAYTDELDHWLRQSSVQGTVENEDPDSEIPTEEKTPAPEEVPTIAEPVDAPRLVPVGKIPSSKQRRWLLALTVAFLIVALGTVAAHLSTRTSEPMSKIRREEHDLVVLDSQDRELWRYRMPDSVQTGQYANFAAGKVDVFLVANVDGESSPELLFIYIPPNFEEVGSTLYCFSDHGKLKWTFKPGREIADKNQRFSASYLVWQMSVILAGPESPLIVLSSYHTVHYPNQVAILTGGGQLFGEYWHSGHLLHTRSLDVDGDGREELLFGGVNNGYRRATIVALDPLAVRGCSTQEADDPFQLQGCGQGSEKAIVRFGRTHYSEKLYQYNRVQGMLVGGGTVEVHVSETIFQTGETLIYQFDRHLNPLGVRPSDTLHSRYRALLAAKELDRPLDEKELQKLRNVEVIRNFSFR